MPVDLEQRDLTVSSYRDRHAFSPSTPTLIERTVTTITTVELSLAGLPFAELGAFRWVDADGTELRDPTEVEVAQVAGLQVSLRNASDDEVARTTTDRLGRYEFDNLPVGDYTVVFIAPSETAATLKVGDYEVPAGWAKPAPAPIQTWTPQSSSALRLVGRLG